MMEIVCLMYWSRGHHENIRKWRKYQSLKKTYLKRPDLLENYEFDE